MSDREYRHAEHLGPIPADSLRKSEPEFQKEVMRTWFFQHYEDPAESTPYESREGGYIFIWGGPYDADEELSSEFYDLVPEETIRELAEELAAQCPQWSGKLGANNLSEYYYSAILSNDRFGETLTHDLEDIEAFLNIASKVDLIRNC
jgi:hypothetical protein